MTDSPRERLLAATMSHVAEAGLADFSLRSVATAIGTSHRMLSHHFGSKAGLEVAIVRRATELLTTPLLVQDADTPDLSAGQQIQRVWEALSEPTLEPLLRLYFDLTNRAASGDPVAVEAVGTIRDHWTRTALTIGDLADDTQELLLGAAVTSTFLKGLLLDRLSGATIAETEAVLRRFIDLVEAYGPDAP